MMLTKRRKIGDFSDEELSSEKMKLEDEFRQIIEDTDWNNLKILSRNEDSFCISKEDCVTSADLFKTNINCIALDESASGNESNDECDAGKLIKDELETNFGEKFNKECNNLSVSGLLSKIKPLVPTNENLRLLFTGDSNDVVLSSQNSDRKKSRKFKRPASYNSEITNNKPGSEEVKLENSDKERIIINWDNKCADLFDSLMKDSLMNSKLEDETEMENGGFSEKENEERGNNIREFRLETVNLNLPTDTENIKFRVNLKHNILCIIRPNNIIEALNTRDGKLYKMYSQNEILNDFKNNCEAIKSPDINNSNSLDSVGEKLYSKDVGNNILHNSHIISLDHNYCQSTGNFKYKRNYFKLAPNKKEFSSTITHLRSARKVKNIDPVAMAKKPDLIVQPNNCAEIQKCYKRKISNHSSSTQTSKSKMKVSDTKTQATHRDSRLHMLDRRKVGEQIQINSALHFVTNSNVLASGSCLGTILMPVNSQCQSQTFQNFSSDNLSGVPFNASFHIPSNISEPAINSTIVNQLQNNRIDFDSTISTLVDLVKKADPSEVNKAIQKFHSDLRLKNLNSTNEHCVPIINNNESVTRHDFKPLKLKILSPETINRNVLNSKCHE